MEIFDVFSMNGIENNPASGEIVLENVILKVSQTHFPRISIPRGGQCPPPPWLSQGGGGINFSRGGNAPPLGGGREVPCSLLPPPSSLLPPPSFLLPPPSSLLPHPSFSPVPTPSTSSYSIPPSLPQRTPCASHDVSFAHALHFPQKISSWNGNFLRAPAHWLATIGFWAFVTWNCSVYA